MRFKVRSDYEQEDIELENFELESVSKVTSWLTAAAVDKWLTVAAIVAVTFLSVSGIYGMFINDFTGFSNVWNEIKTPLFASAVFLVRGKIDEK